MRESIATALQQINWQRAVFRSSLLLCVASLLLVGSLVGWHLQDRKDAVNSARGLARETARDAAAEIGQALEKVMVAQKVADELTSGSLSDETVENRLIEELARNPTLGAVTACYVPEFVPDRALQANRNLYCPFSYTNPDGDIYIERIEELYDYTLPDGSTAPDGTPIRSAWYHRPLAEGPVWGEPYFGTATKVYWAGFGAPFYRVSSSDGAQALAGVIDVSLTLREFQQLVSSVNLGQPAAGYGFILSQSGKFIYHPIEALVTEQRTISDLNQLFSIEYLHQSATTPGSEEVIVFDHTDENSGRSSWVYFAPITPAGWWVGIVLDKGTIFQSNEIVGRLRRQQIGIALGALAFLIFLTIPLSGAHIGTTSRLWAVSISFSLLCIAGISFLWYSNISSGSADDARDVMLVERGITEKVAADYGRQTTSPIYVPTGLQIQSMEFSSTNNINLTGYVWQTYADDAPEWAKPGPQGPPGFILPQASINYEEDISEAYRRRQGRHEVIGWNFRAQLRHEFDNSRYPFDRKDLAIRILHKDFDQGVILKPDLLSYSTTDPQALPGLMEEDVFLEGWNIKQSFFSYRDPDYSTTFGIPNLGAQRTPELYYHIGLTRRFVNAFISQVIPLAVVALLLFAVLVIVTSREERIQVFGFSTSAVLAYCAALFFVVVVAHIGLRSALADPAGIIYIEFLYFLIYGAILSVSLNSILFTSTIEVWFIQYRDNMIMELLFWPILIGLFLVVSLFVFL